MTGAIARCEVSAVGPFGRIPCGFPAAATVIEPGTLRKAFVCGPDADRAVKSGWDVTWLETQHA